MLSINTKEECMEILKEIKKHFYETMYSIEFNGCAFIVVAILVLYGAVSMFLDLIS